MGAIPCFDCDGGMLEARVERYRDETSVGVIDIPGVEMLVCARCGSREMVEEGCRYRDWETDRKSTRLNSSHITRSRMPSSA